MQTRHVQATFSPMEYEEVLQRASREGITLKEAVRRAVLSWAHFGSARKDPIYGMIGIGKGGAPERLSDLDEELYGTREE